MIGLGRPWRFLHSTHDKRAINIPHTPLSPPTIRVDTIRIEKRVDCRESSLTKENVACACDHQCDLGIQERSTPMPIMPF